MYQSGVKVCCFEEQQFYKFKNHKCIGCCIWGHRSLYHINHKHQDLLNSLQHSSLLWMSINSQAQLRVSNLANCNPIHKRHMCMEFNKKDNYPNKRQPHNFYLYSHPYIWYIPLVLSIHQHTYQNRSYDIVHLYIQVCMICIFLDSLKDISHNSEHYTLNIEQHRCLKLTHHHKLSRYYNLQNAQDNYRS